ncbi:MAG: Nif11-like leader peptide family natural product precursor [Coriobacteriaceae bacterium]|nr:Nif11-like leader peptide family natural product precursor [Coriobacteriaceae bacterium]
MNFEELTPEQQERARSAKTPEEILALAQEAGYELSEEELDQINGGMMWGDVCVGVACQVCRGYKGCKVY